MFPIICRWKLVKHLDCFGDNKRTKDYQKYQVIFVLKPVVWLYSVYSIFHYGISEKTNKKSNGLNYTQTCLHQHANYLPYSFPSNWNILAFVVYNFRFTYTYMQTCICKLPFIQLILLETKMTPLISQIRCLPFWAACSLWLSRFFKLYFRLFIPTF